jgi:hypothetical protein
MFMDWKRWFLIVVLLVSGYVQDVGMHFEHASGLKRLENLRTYHFLFRGAAWPFFRWGGFIRIACIGIILFLFDWRQAVVCGVGAVALSFALWRVTKGHALTMLEQVTDLNRVPGCTAEPPSVGVGGVNSTDAEMLSKTEHQYIANTIQSAVHEAVAGHCDESMAMLEITQIHRPMFECMYYALVLSVIEAGVYEKHSEEAAEDIMRRAVQGLVTMRSEDCLDFSFEDAFQHARDQYIGIWRLSVPVSPISDDTIIRWAKAFVSEVAVSHHIPCSEWKTAGWAVATVTAINNASRQL